MPMKTFNKSRQMFGVKAASSTCAALVNRRLARDERHCEPFVTVFKGGLLDTDFIVMLRTDNNLLRRQGMI
ncbi:hypothetical protein [Salinibius halmophilus]|uniref:hypothetical protein n=1 Tax=Salinibius halmophilus TaxID=1853216 RepID=UPI000E665126|nr:hypothetical protein [Salinibius halmophilus]